MVNISFKEANGEIDNWIIELSIRYTCHTSSWINIKRWYQFRDLEPVISFNSSFKRSSIKTKMQWTGILLILFGVGKLA